MTTSVRHVYVNGHRIEVDERDPAVAASPRCCHTGGKPAMVSTEGNDTTPAVTETYLAEVMLPFLATVTGIALFNGSAVDGNVTLALYDAAGFKVAGTASTEQADTDTYQRVPFETAVQLPAGTYYVAAQFDSTSARFNSHIFGDFGAGKLTGQTYGVLPKVTPPSTFTTALGPIASLY